MTSALLLGVGVLMWLVWMQKFSSALGGALLAGTALVPIVALLSLRSAALYGAQHIVKGQVPGVVLRPAFHSLFLFVVCLFAAQLTPASAMWLGVLSAALSLLVAHWLLKRALPKAEFSAVAETDPRQWWVSAVPMAMTEGMRVLQAHLLIFLLGAMASMEEVGVFRVAASTVVLVGMPLSLFNVVSMPIIARLHAAGHRTQLERMLTLVSVGMTAGVLLLSLPFFLAGERLLGRVFGQEFAEGAVALSILCVSLIVNAIVGPVAALLNMTSHQKHVTFASLAALIVLVVTSPPLIYAQGIQGAAIANLLSAIIWCAFMWRASRRLLGLDPSVIGIIYKPNGKAS